MADLSGEAAAALAALERALAARPKPDDAAFVDATTHLVALRDGLREAGAGGDALNDVNGCISTVLGGHFPLGPVRWEQLEAARDRLGTLVTRLGG